MKQILLFISRCLNLLSPTLNTRLFYFYKKRKWPNLKNPKTFDEKISWLKLHKYNESDLIARCADKYLVREYLIEKGLGHLLNDLYGVYDKPEDIDWERLPDQFIIKWNMSSRKYIICRDKKNLNISETIKTLKKMKKIKKYLSSSELHYGKTPPKIIIEKLLLEKDGSLPLDYKFHSYNGQTKHVMIATERETGNPKFYYFDRDWNFLRINRDSKSIPDNFEFDKPNKLDEAFEYANILSEGFPFVRVDFYILDNKIIFGELTFTPGAGANLLGGEWTHETDDYFGNFINLDDDVTKNFV